VVRLRSPRRRSRHGLWLALVGLAFAAAAAAGGVVAWPHLAPFLEPPAGPDPGPGAGTGGKAGGGGLPGAAGAFPRRALVVSINNYLYANPVNYGMTMAGARNVHTLLDRLTTGLRIPRDQIAELSDAAPRGEARLPIDPVIRETVTDFLGTARAQDRVVLLLVGHVVENGDEMFLVPLDGDPEARETLIPFKWLYDSLAACKARQKVLVLDTCRLNPARGEERPGSGKMSAKLDALLKAPPEGVQVWTACVADQYSYEFEDAETFNGLFLDELYATLERGLDNAIQKPTDPLPLERLAEEVNRSMKARLEPLGKVQTSRVSGSEPAEGAAYDPAEPAPPRPKVAPLPGRPGVSLETVKGILKGISFPPLKVSKEQSALPAEALPPFPKEVLEPYLVEGAATPLREEVEKARALMSDLAQKPVLKDGYRAPGGDETRFKGEVKKDQMEVAQVILDLKEELEALQAAGKKHRKKESKRWQANYDYVLARLEAQIAYLDEYDALLGQMRKELPPRDPKQHNGWRLASLRELPRSDSDAKKLAGEANKLLDKIGKDYPNTPWAVLAKRDKYSALGLEWQPTK
jgi:hypothetical protein